jgi:hypothetical protein
MVSLQFESGLVVYYGTMPYIDPLHWRHKSLECPPDAP